MIRELSLLDLLEEERNVVRKYNFTLEKIEKRVARTNEIKESATDNITIKVADQIYNEDMEIYNNDKEKAEKEIKEIRKKIKQYLFVLMK